MERSDSWPEKMWKMFDRLDAIDRALTLALNGSGNAFLDRIAMTATQTSTWLPLFAVLLFLVVRGNRGNWRGLLCTFAAVGLCVLLCDAFVSFVVKPLVARPRPTHNAEIGALVVVVNGYRGGAYGFFSSHAANTAAVATLLSLLFRRKVFTAHMFAWVVLCCWTRVYLGVHYVGDLVAGFLWGIAVGASSCWLLRRANPAASRGCRQISVVPLVCVLWLTVVGIAVRAAF